MAVASRLLARKASAIVVLLSLAAPVAAVAKEPEVLLPSSPWNVEYADKKCSASRVFGADKSAVTVLLEQFGPGDWVKLSFVGDRFRRWRERDIKLRFGPDEAWQTLAFLTGTHGPDSPAAFLRNTLRIEAPASQRAEVRDGDMGTEPPPISTAQQAAVRTLDIRYFTSSLSLATGRLDKLFAEFSRCNDNLVKAWGFDPAVMKLLTAKPIPLTPPPSWLRAADYPKGAVKRRARAIVVVRLNVDQNGSATECEIQQSSTGDEFKSAVCSALLSRARFKPAVDASGNPVAAYWRSYVVFLLQG